MICISQTFGVFYSPRQNSLFSLLNFLRVSSSLLPCFFVISGPLQTPCTTSPCLNVSTNQLIMRFAFTSIVIRLKMNLTIITVCQIEQFYSLVPAGIPCSFVIVSSACTICYNPPLLYLYIYITFIPLPQLRKNAVLISLILPHLWERFNS